MQLGKGKWKNWRTILLAGLMGSILVVGLIINDAFFQKTKAQIIGQVPREDILQIERISRIEFVKMRYGGSWFRMAKHTPSAARFYLSHPVKSIKAKDDGTVEVLFPHEWRDDCGFDLQKSTNGWKITVRIFS